MSAGSMRLTREQLALITGGDPRAIKAFEDFFALINNIGSHASTHEPGGSDPLAVDAAASVGSLRTLGTGALKAAAGIHAATHVTGGGDTIANAVAGGNAGLLSGADKAKLDALGTTEVAYTPTFTGFGVASAVNFTWTRVGNRCKVMGKFTSGNETAVEPQISLPNSLVSDPVLIPSIQLCGVFVRNANLAVSYYVLIESGVSYVTLSAQAVGANGLTKIPNASTSFNPGEIFSFQFEVPIQGWNV